MSDLSDLSDWSDKSDYSNYLFLGSNALFVLNDADALRDDDADTVVSNLLFQNLDELVVVLGQGYDMADVVGVDTKSLADVEQLHVGTRGLTTGHSGDVVVENHHDDVGFLVDAVEQTGHAAVSKSTVTDNCHGGEDAHFGSTFSHGDGSTHANGGVQSTHVEAKGVATDVAKHATMLILLHHVNQCGVAVDVGAANAESGRTVGNHLGHCGTVGDIHTEGFSNLLSIQFAVATNHLVQTTMYGLAFAQTAFNLLFDEGLAIFEYQNLVALVIQLAQHSGRQRILGNLHYGIGALAAGEVLQQVVVGNTSGHDAAALVGAGDVLVETALFGGFLKLGLLVNQVAIQHLGIGGQQHESLGVGGVVDGVLGQRLAALNTGTAVGQTGGDAHQDGGAHLFAQLVAEEDHVVGLLLVAGFQHGNHSPVAIETAVLLVLRGEHRGIVGHNDDDTLGADDRGIHEGVATDIQTYMLHASHGTFAGVGNADRGLEGCFLVGAPVGTDAFLGCLFRFDYIFCDLRGGGAGITVDGTATRVNKGLSNCFVT